MKSFAALALVLASTSVQASDVHLGFPLLKMSETSGFVHPDSRTSRHCVIHERAVRIVRSIRGTKVTETRRVDVDASIVNLIEEASQGEIMEFPTPTDVPMTYYTAHLPGDETGERILLAAKFMGQNSELNQSSAAALLINLIEDLCK